MPDTPLKHPKYSQLFDWLQVKVVKGRAPHNSHRPFCDYPIALLEQEMDAREVGMPAPIGAYSLFP